MNQMTPIAWPVKSREIHNHHMDSTVWNDFKFRSDDVVVATYGKSGTTWTQQIVAQLIFNGAESIDVSAMSPWVDLRIMPKAVIDGLALQTHRRVLKTHLPVDALVFSPKAKYNLHRPRWARCGLEPVQPSHQCDRRLLRRLQQLSGPAGSAARTRRERRPCLLRRWFEENGEPYWPFWENIRSWWRIRHLPNVLMLHFSDMKRDLPGAIRRIADSWISKSTRRVSRTSSGTAASTI